MKQYLQPFVQVTKTVFKKLLDCDLIPQKAHFIKKEAFLQWDISGLIALTGGTKGLVSLSMKYPTASKIAERLGGGMEADMTDAIGELANIISGNVQKELEDHYNIVISPPKVVRGKAHLVVIPEDRTRLLCIPFIIFETDTIWLSISID